MSEAAAAGNSAAFEALMRRHNQKLFRVARAILKDDADAEDAVQDAYLQAYRSLDSFRADAEMATWLTRIVINQALMRLRKQRRKPAVVPFRSPGERGGPDIDVADVRNESPPEAALRGEIRRLLERRIDELPVSFRTVFVMRDVEDMSVQETADALGIPPATVRTRLFRARTLLRERLARDADTATLAVFGFDGDRCDRIVLRVLGACATTSNPSRQRREHPRLPCIQSSRNRFGDAFIFFKELA